VNDDVHRSCRVSSVIPGGYRTPISEWPAIQARCIDAMVRLHGAIQPLLDSEEFRRL